MDDLMPEAATGQGEASPTAEPPSPRKAPPIPCEHCGRDTVPWKIAFMDGRRLCPDCIALSAPRPAPAWRLPAIIGGVALGLVLIGLLIIFVGKVPQKLAISRCFHARTVAYRTEDEEVVNDYTDYATVMQEIKTAAEKGGDADPATTTDTIWVRFVGPATLSGKVVSIKGDTAVIEDDLGKLPNGQPGTFVVRYQLERSDKDIWRVTHVLNADEIYRAYAAASIQ